MHFVLCREQGSKTEVIVQYEVDILGVILVS